MTLGIPERFCQGPCHAFRRPRVWLHSITSLSIHENTYNSLAGGCEGLAPLTSIMPADASIVWNPKGRPVPASDECIDPGDGNHELGEWFKGHGVIVIDRHVVKR